MNELQVSVHPSSLLSGTPLFDHTTFCLSIHLPTDIFWLLAIVNKAAVNISVQGFV